MVNNFTKTAPLRDPDSGEKESSIGMYHYAIFIRRSLLKVITLLKSWFLNYNWFMFFSFSYELIIIKSLLDDLAFQGTGQISSKTKKLALKSLQAGQVR